MSNNEIVYGEITTNDIPDRESYRRLTVSPRLVPWLIPGEMTGLHALIKSATLVSRQGLYSLHKLALQCLHIPGEFWECGVYTGGTAEFVALMTAHRPQFSRKQIRLFDTFEGMPETNSKFDLHKKGDFSVAHLWNYITDRFSRYKNVSLHRGFIPDTFQGLEASRIAFVHCDLDIYQSIHDCLAFCYPRMESGAIVLFDDYGHITCPGARLAVDEFFADKPEKPYILCGGQAFVVKL